MIRIQIQLLSKIPQRQLFVIIVILQKNNTYFVENCRSHYHIMRHCSFCVRVSRKKYKAMRGENLKKLLCKGRKYDKMYN